MCSKLNNSEILDLYRTLYFIKSFHLLCEHLQPPWEAVRNHFHFFRSENETIKGLLLSTSHNADANHCFFGYFFFPLMGMLSFIYSDIDDTHK